MYGKRLRVCFILGSLVFLFSSLHASQGRIVGFVFDSQTSEPLPAANVLIKGTSLGAATDVNGRFSISQIPPGNYQLVVKYIGYVDKTVDVSVIVGEVAEPKIALDFQSIAGESITITAQAEGQIQAINQQLSSNTISNIVSQARIRELPDINAAESIGRLPGVSIERSGGEATKVSIRGLSPKYNTVTVNGVRLPATGADDRSVDLSLISSNMLDGIEVRKANTPDMDADALGGTVDLKLREAPTRAAFNVQAMAGYNRLQDYFGNYNITANLSKRFYDERLGVIAGFNTDDYDRSADKLQGTYRERLADSKILPESLTMREETVSRGRTGASLLLDYRLPAGKVSAYSFYNHLKWDGLYRINRMNLTNTGSSNRHYYDIEDRGGTTSLFTGNLGIEQDFDWIRYDLGVARTSSRSKNPDENTWQFVEESGAFTRTEFDTDTKAKDIPTYAVNDTFRTFLSEVWIWDTNREEDQTSLQFNFQLPFNLSNSIGGFLKTGGKFRWLDRMNDVEYRGRNGIQYGGSGNEMLAHLDRAIPEWGVQALVDEHGQLPISLFLDNYSRSNFLEGQYPLGFTVNQAMLERVTQVLSDSGDVLPFAINSLASDYNGTERYQAGYLMADLKLGKIFSLLPGVRYEKDYSKYSGYRFREQTVNNIQGPPADLDTLENVREHDFWLPMVHLRVEPNDWLKVRLAYTHSLTRPDFNQYAPTTRIDTFFGYLRAANAQLRPAKSINYDAAVSVYQNKVGLFTVAGFYKDIDDLIFQTRYEFKPGVPVPEGFNIPANWLIGHSPNADLYINNPFKATYKGFELDWQTHFWYLPSVLKGLVLNVNYTRIESETEKQLYFTVEDSLIRIRPPVWTYKVVDSTRTARMPDQPAHILNGTLGYDFKGFSARLSYLYQTDKVTFIDRKAVLDNFSGSYARWDLTLQQKLGMGVELFGNFTNLNGRPDENFRGDSQNPTYIEYYGFTMDIGARYRF